MPDDLVSLSADIISAYIQKNHIPQSELPALIATVHAALPNIGQPQAGPDGPLVPPVSIKRSVTADYIISLEDGRRYRSLKRHLSARGLTPEQYRAKWGLPWDYPMVAPSPLLRTLSRLRQKR
jgi:predicted transcriptional regulator